MSKKYFLAVLTLWLLTYLLPFNYGISLTTMSEASFSGIQWIVAHWILFVSLALLIVLHYWVKEKAMSLVISAAMVFMILFLLTLPFHFNLFGMGLTEIKSTFKTIFGLLRYGYYVNVVFGLGLIFVIVKEKIGKKVK